MAIAWQAETVILAHGENVAGNVKTLPSNWHKVLTG